MAESLQACFRRIDSDRALIAQLVEQLRATRHDLAIAEDALEAERQWRLTSLPALLAAEERAVKAEERLATVLMTPRQFPELTRSQAKRHAALADAYHAETERP